MVALVRTIRSRMPEPRIIPLARLMLENRLMSRTVVLKYPESRIIRLQWTHLIGANAHEGRFASEIISSCNLYVKDKLYTDDILIRLRVRRWLRRVLVRDVRNLIMAHTRGIASSCLCKDDTHLTFLTYTMPNIYRVALLQHWNYIITSTSCIYAYIRCSSTVC